MFKKKLFLKVLLAMLLVMILVRPLNYFPNNAAVPCKFMACPGAGFPFDWRPYNDELGQYNFAIVILVINLIFALVAAAIISRSYSWYKQRSK